MEHQVGNLPSRRSRDIEVKVSCRTWLKNIFGPTGRPKSATSAHVRSPSISEISLERNVPSDTGNRAIIGDEAALLGYEAWKSGDNTEARYYYEIGTAAGNATASHNLGTMLLHGQGIERNFGRARICFSRAANAGVAASMSQLGYMSLFGLGVEKDRGKARLFFKQAAVRGYAFGQYYSGAIILNGLGPEYEDSVGEEWLEKAAGQGLTPAIFNLGVLYSQSLSSPLDQARATALYASAAMRGDVNARLNLAVIYLTSPGREAHTRQAAIELLRECAKCGLSEGLYNLAQCYMQGICVIKSLTMALPLYEQAADRGNKEAAFRLGCLYLVGQGSLHQDRRRALHYFDIAAKLGHEGAKHNSELLSTNRYRQRGQDHATARFGGPLKPGPTLRFTAGS